MLELIQAKPLLILGLFLYVVAFTVFAVWLTAKVSVWIVSDSKQGEKGND